MTTAQEPHLSFRIRRLLWIAIALLPSIVLAQLDRPNLSSFANQERSQLRPLPLEQAFPFYVSQSSPGNYKVVWESAPEHYLYREQFKFSLRHGPDTEPVSLSFDIPPGLKKTDEFFGEVEVYYDQLAVTLVLPAQLDEGSELLIEYQGCADWGFCYPPQESVFPLN